MGTGGGPSRYCPLSPLEEQVVQLLSFDGTIDGVSAKSFGAACAFTKDNSPSASTSNSPPEEVIEVNDVQADCVNGNIQPQSVPAKFTKRNSSTPKKDYAMLLEKQVENQTCFQESSVEMLELINQNLSTLVQENKKRYKLELLKYQLEKKKFDLMKRRMVIRKKM